MTGLKIKHKSFYRNIHRIIILLTVLSIYSCQEYLDVEIEQEEEKIIVNSIFQPYNYMKFEVLKSFSLSSIDLKNKNLITDAEIFIYKENEIIEIIREKDSIYRSSFIPANDQEYNMKVVIPGYDTIRSTNNIPLKVSIDSVSRRLYTSEGNNLTSLECKISMTDPEEYVNYYLFTISIEYLQDNGAYLPVSFNYSNIFGARDFSVIENNIFIGNRGLLFSDKLINGESYTIEINIWEWVINYNNSLSPCKINFHLLTLTEDLYLYANSFVKQNTLGTNPFREFFNVYSNIENGLGIFAGYNISTQSIIYKWGDN